MRVRDMTKTVWRVGDRIKLTARPFDQHDTPFDYNTGRAMSNAVMDFDSAIITELGPNFMEIRARQDDGDEGWWYIRPSQIQSIEPITALAVNEHAG